MYRAGSISHRPTRCEDGNLMRFDPQDDDPYLETNVGKCPECEGQGCVNCDGCGEFIAPEHREAATNIPPDYLPEDFRKRATIVLCELCRTEGDEA